MLQIESARLETTRKWEGSQKALENKVGVTQ